MTRGPSNGDLLWVTNVPTPYRAPLWSALGDQHDLTVALLAETEPDRHWQVNHDRDRYSVESLRAKPIGHSDGSVIYAPSLHLLSLIWRRPKTVVLDGWESPAFLTARLCARLRGVPLIASYRSTQSTHRFTRGPISRLRRWFFRGADIVLTAGTASTEAVLAMGVPRSRIVEGFSTVDVERFSDGAKAARQGAPARPGHHFLFVGRFIECKNLDMLIRAFADMRGEDDTLSLVGAGPLEARLRRLVNELGLADSVHFLGHLDGDELVATYASANTLILASTKEVWGLVVNEALAAGLHVVVSDRCGIAPSISGMPGVFITEPEQTDLAWAMRLSFATWTGPLDNHPVASNTTIDLAQTISTAVGEIRVRLLEAKGT